MIKTQTRWFTGRLREISSCLQGDAKWPAMSAGSKEHAVLRGWLCLHTEPWVAQGQTDNPRDLAQGSCKIPASSLGTFLQGAERWKLQRAAWILQNATVWMFYCTVQCSTGWRSEGFCWASGKVKFSPFSSPALCLQRHFLGLTRTCKVLHFWASLLPCPEVAASRAGFAVRSLSLLFQQWTPSLSSDDMSELAEWVTCMSGRKTPVLLRTRSLTVAGSALQLSYNLVLPPHLPSPSNCFWTDGKLAAWQCDCSLAFSHSPQICFRLYKESLFFSFLLPPSTTNQFTQKSIVSTTGELLRLGTSSTRVPTFQWAKLDQSIEGPCWGCPYQGNMTMQVQCDSSSWSFLVRRNQISSNASRARLTSELGRNARHFDCLELFLSGRCSQDGLLKK